MATTSNFGWTTPDDTDLVKDGALAIRTLGNNIDTSLVDLKGGTTGQILAKNSNTDLDYTWINNDQGDITAVTAGTGISGGGTSGAITITNSMATEITAKGDLIVGTGNATFDNLAAGSNGETLVADSTTTTGLRWQADWNVGKNKIINGDFRINQRAFTSTTTGGVYLFDRFRNFATDGTTTFTAQTFTPGTAPVAGYEGQNYLRIATTGQTAVTANSSFNQYIEDVRTFAGQTITFSFWAKANSGTPNVSVEAGQVFGSGGSPSSTVTGSVATGTVKKIGITTSWARYSATLTIPSISGKTIGTDANSSYLYLGIYVSAGSNFNTRTDSLGIQTNTFEFWGLQAEAGSVATPFTTATGTLAGELAACQRYYVRFTAGSVYARYGTGAFESTTRMSAGIQLPVTMRVAPTLGEQSNLATWDYGTVRAATAVSLDANTTQNIAQIVVDIASGGTAFRPAMVLANNTTSSFLAFGAEL